MLLIVLTGAGISIYWLFKKPNVFIEGKRSEIIYIPTGSAFEDVLNVLYENNIVKNHATFEWFAERKKYRNNVKPGRYRILAGMSNNELINLLRSGMQEPVNVTFHTIRTKDQLVTKVCSKLEADSGEFRDKLSDNDYLSRYGFARENVIAFFIPNTYQFNWNTSVDEFMHRMANEYKKFWNAERKQKQKATGLTQSEVMTLASIVQAEQWRFNDEKKTIAGLYINRIKKGMPLQSDPTLIFAKGDFTVNRVLNEDMKIDSPYNTYRHTGLPPGPICLPEISSIDAVLNYEKTDYLYMCAKEDLSGRHNFAVTLDQHNIYAAKFRQALNKRNIMR